MAAPSPAAPCPANLCEVHHRNPYATNPVTDVNDLTLACGPNHKLAEQGWTTRKNAHGDTEWIPPPHLDHGQPRINTYHHPEKLLRDDDEVPYMPRRAESRYSPVNFGGRFSNVAEMPSVRSFDGRNAAFHAAT